MRPRGNKTKPLNRYLEEVIQRFAFSHQKMAFVSGPRQCGKTTLGKILMDSFPSARYFNWDDKDFRKAWTLSPVECLKSRLGKSTLFVLDELHKAKGWKRDLKGVYDYLRDDCRILVTGSARLNVYKKGGDSLMGRYFPFRLHPFTLREALGKSPNSPESAAKEIFKKGRMGENLDAGPLLKQLLEFGGFPDPFLTAQREFHQIWQQNRIEKIVREDLRDLSRLPELSQVEMLISLLPDHAAQLVSVESLRRDLEVAHTTIKRWLNYLTELYYCYFLRPHVGSLRRSLRKEPKLFLWDWSEVELPGPRFENLIANHLLKACHYWTDTGSGIFELHYLRNKEKEEVDFLVTHKSKPWLIVECKTSRRAVSGSLVKYINQLGLERGVQVLEENGVHEHRTLKGGGSILVTSASHFLAHLA